MTEQKAKRDVDPVILSRWRSVFRLDEAIKQAELEEEEAEYHLSLIRERKRLAQHQKNELLDGISAVYRNWESQS